MSLTLSAAQLKPFWSGASDAIIAATVAAWPAVQAKYNFNTPLRCAHFWGQITWECGGGTELRENLSYSAPRIVQVFGGPHARVTGAESLELAHNPQALGERVYGLGNPWMASQLGNTQKGDGYNFRGAGALNTTGRDAFVKVGKAINQDFIAKPELADDPGISLWMGAEDYSQLGCQVIADADNTLAETKKINGGTNGLDGRVALIAKWKHVFS
jgi:putative chitinase